MECKTVTLSELLAAGVHFGHQTRYGSPKMKPYIYGVKNRIHIIDLRLTLSALQEVQKLMSQAAERGSRILFVGTKKAAEAWIKSTAVSCGQHYVNQRWLGGTLTNWKTVRRSVKSLKDLMKQKASGAFDLLPKKEQLLKEKWLQKLEARLGGLIHLNGLPDYLFVIDVQKERIAIQEAQKIGIPTLAIVDTNVSTEGVTHPIPGNDDSIAAIKLYLQIIAQAIEVGKSRRQTALASTENAEGAGGQQPEEALPLKAAPVEAVSPAH